MPSSIGGLIHTFLKGKDPLSVIKLIREIETKATTVEAILSEWKKITSESVDNEAVGVDLLVLLMKGIRAVSESMAGAFISQFVSSFDSTSNMQVRTSCLDGLLVVVTKATVMTDSDVLVVAEFIRGLKTQTMAWVDRLHAYSIFHNLLLHAAGVLSSLENPDFLSGMLKTIYGEDDPRCLQAVFSLVTDAINCYDDLPEAQTVFDAISGYYPISFTENKDIKVKKNEISSCLLGIFCTRALASISLPFLMDKLRMGTIENKKGIVNDIVILIKSQGTDFVKQKAPELWRGIRREILRLEVNPSVLDALSTLIDSIIEILSVEDISFLKSFLEPFIEDLLLHLRYFEYGHHTNWARLASHIAGVNLTTAGLVTPVVMNHLTEQYKESEDSFVAKKAIFDVYGEIIPQVAKLTKADDSPLRIFVNSIHELVVSVLSLPSQVDVLATKDDDSFPPQLETISVSASASLTSIVSPSPSMIFTSPSDHTISSLAAGSSNAPTRSQINNQVELNTLKQSAVSLMSLYADLLPPARLTEAINTLGRIFFECGKCAKEIEKRTGGTPVPISLFENTVLSTVTSISRIQHKEAMNQFIQPLLAQLTEYRSLNALAVVSENPQNFEKVFDHLVSSTSFTTMAIIDPSQESMAAPLIDTMALALKNISLQDYSLTQFAIPKVMTICELLVSCPISQFSYPESRVEFDDEIPVLKFEADDGGKFCVPAAVHLVNELFKRCSVDQQRSFIELFSKKIPTGLLGMPPSSVPPRHYQVALNLALSCVAFMKNASALPNESLSLQNIVSEIVGFEKSMYSSWTGSRLAIGLSSLLNKVSDPLGGEPLQKVFKAAEVAAKERSQRILFATLTLAVKGLAHRRVEGSLVLATRMMSMFSREGALMTEKDLRLLSALDAMYDARKEKIPLLLNGFDESPVELFAVMATPLMAFLKDATTPGSAHIHALSIIITHTPTKAISMNIRELIEAIAWLFPPAEGAAYSLLRLLQPLVSVSPGEVLVDHVPTLLNPLCDLCVRNSSPKVRKLALEIVRVLAQDLQDRKISVEMKTKTLKKLQYCLDDPKKSARAEAVRCKDAWTMLNPRPAAKATK